MCCCWTSVETFLTLPWRLRSTLSVSRHHKNLISSCCTLWGRCLLLWQISIQVEIQQLQRDPDGPDTTTHTHSQFSTHHCEAVSAVWFISQLQSEFLETSNPETLPFGNFHISHIQKKRRAHTDTHTRTLKLKTPSVWQQQTNTQVVKSIMYAQQDAEVLIWCCAIFDVQHCWTRTRMWKWGHLFTSARKMSEPLMALRSASATVNCTGNKLGPKDKNCK